MKTNLTKPLTFFILGPPRSGTTIVCNLFNALGDGFCLGEPHWHKYATCGVVPKHVLTYCGRFHPDYLLTGYKETYRLKHELCELIVNQHLPQIDFFLIVLRDPIMVHSSQRALGWTEWDTPDDHNATYKRLDELAQHEKAIVVVYEDFVQDPLGYLNARLPFQISDPLELKPTGHTFGDPFANRSTEIVQSQRQVCLSDEEIGQHRDGREIWKKWRGRNALTNKA